MDYDYNKKNSKHYILFLLIALAGLFFTERGQGELQTLYSHFNGTRYYYLTKEENEYFKSHSGNATNYEIAQKFQIVKLPTGKEIKVNIRYGLLGEDNGKKIYGNCYTPDRIIKIKN